MDILRVPQLVMLYSSANFCNIFLQNSSTFSLQTLTKFEAPKIGSGAGFLILTAVRGHWTISSMTEETVDFGSESGEIFTALKTQNFERF